MATERNERRSVRSLIAEAGGVKKESLARVLDYIERETIEEFKERLLSKEAIDAAEETSSRRTLRGPVESQRYRQRLREVIEAAAAYAEEPE